ncbi:MAG: WxL domain-containing protein [Sporolactobacillus sp.]
MEMLLKKRSWAVKAVAALSLASVLVLSGHGISHAATSATTNAQVAVTGGNLSIATANPTVNFGSVALSSTAQTVNATVGDVDESDLTGTGAGWHVAVGASPFSTGGTTPNKLPEGSLSLSAPTGTDATGGTTSAAPTVTSGAPWLVDSGNSVNVLSAATGTGMGTYATHFTAPIALTVPSSAYVGTYSSTLTWQIITAP